MSYSIGPYRAATKTDALTALANAFDTQVLPQQPVHSHDRELHLNNVKGQLALLPEPREDEEFAVGMSGWLSYSGGGTALPYTITGGGFGGSAQIVKKEAPKVTVS